MSRKTNSSAPDSLYFQGHLDGVTGVGQVLEVDAGVDGGVPVLVQVDVDTGDDPLGEGPLDTRK